MFINHRDRRVTLRRPPGARARAEGRAEELMAHTRNKSTSTDVSMQVCVCVGVMYMYVEGCVCVCVI